MLSIMGRRKESVVSLCTLNLRCWQHVSLITRQVRLRRMCDSLLPVSTVGTKHKQAGP